MYEVEYLFYVNIHTIGKFANIISKFFSNKCRSQIKTSILRAMLFPLNVERNVNAAIKSEN